MDRCVWANIVDPDQTAPEGGSAMVAIFRSSLGSNAASDLKIDNLLPPNDNFQ